MARVQTRTGGRAATAAIIPGRFALSVGMPDRPAPEGWLWTPLADVARLESGHTPSRKHPEYWGGSIPWIGIRDATGNHGRVLYDTAECTNELGIANSSARLLPANTVCLSRTASVGFVVVMGRPMATSQDFVNWVCSDRLNPHFLKYVLLSEWDALRTFAVGSVHPTIYFPEVKAFHVCLPRRCEQDRIADVLGALDDKIDLNRRMNDKLEAMARAIFKDWFVDFGPTRAKMEGRAPYLAPDLWALFPDRLDEDGKPEGWPEGTLLDLCELKRGYDLPTAQRRLGPIPIVSSSGVSGHHDTAMVDGPGVVTGRYGTIGEVFFLDEPFWPLNTALYVRDFNRNSPHFVFRVVSRLNFESYSDKGAVPGINRNDLHRAPVILPSKEVQDAFDRLLVPFWTRSEVNRHESVSLAATRDLLLPKLMSGEVRIRAAEKVLEDVA